MTSEQLEYQIRALEKRRDGLVYQSKSWYSIEGKIKNLKKLLVKIKQFEFEAR